MNDCFKSCDLVRVCAVEGHEAGSLCFIFSGECWMFPELGRPDYGMEFGMELESR